MRCGWLPCYPQFTESNADVIETARTGGAETNEEIVRSVVDRLKDRSLKFAMEDPDKEECWPRVWYIWRGNAIQSSAKGHEYFLKHYLGHAQQLIAKECAEDVVEDVTWHDKLDTGKMDLVVDLNFRMDTSALYSDIVLPAATYYEKDDLSSTDMHSFIHPLQKAVPPCWESKSDWQIFRELAKHTAALAAEHFPEPVDDILITPLQHDTPAEIAQPTVKDWAKGRVRSDSRQDHARHQHRAARLREPPQPFISLGPGFRNKGLGVHGTVYPVSTTCTTNT